MPVLANADFSVGEFLLWLVWIFLFVVWFWLLITIFADIFRRHDIHGFAKTMWVIFVIVLPFLGIFIYLIVNSHGIADRRMKQAQAAQTQMDDYVKSVAGSGDSAEQIAKGKELLDSGAITQAEFDQLKAKALA